jgi:hypothetical protein
MFVESDDALLLGRICELTPWTERHDRPSQRDIEL